MNEFEKLEEAIEIGRVDGRIKGIKEAFKKYKKSLRKPSRWERTKRWFKGLI